MRKEMFEELAYHAAVRKITNPETSDRERFVIAKKYGIDFDDHYDMTAMWGQHEKHQL